MDLERRGGAERKGAVHIGDEIYAPGSENLGHRAENLGQPAPLVGAGGWGTV